MRSQARVWAVELSVSGGVSLFLGCLFVLQWIMFVAWLIGQKNETTATAVPSSTPSPDPSSSTDTCSCQVPVGSGSWHGYVPGLSFVQEIVSDVSTWMCGVYVVNIKYAGFTMLLGPVLGGVGTICTWKVFSWLASSKEALDFVTWKSQGLPRGCPPSSFGGGWEALPTHHSSSPFPGQFLNAQCITLPSASSSQPLYSCDGVPLAATQPKIIYLQDCNPRVGAVQDAQSHQLKIRQPKSQSVLAFSHASAAPAIRWIQ